MIQKKINLREDDPDIYMTTYLSELKSTPYDAMLVIPGGGYYDVCADREGEPIALAYMTAGFNAFVLHYSVKEKAVFPRSLCDASLALSYIRAHAEEFNINPDRIFVVGFSAGGHLAGSLGVMWDIPEICEITGIEPGSNKPNGVVLGYPVVSGKRCATHLGSFQRLLGKNDPTDEELELYSLENHVKAETAAPMFAFHTATDPVVPVASPLLLALAYAKAGLPFELHVFPQGPHGLALANRATSHGNPNIESRVSSWVSLSVDWIKGL
ncbi:MAG: alpha/beta hydrolase [Ruminococcaceae bacterium]|nr:alpha/beta hydrolase [Oscillospiraceae bacterium]